MYMYISLTPDDKVLDASALGGRRLEIGCAHLKRVWDGSFEGPWGSGLPFRGLWGSGLLFRG